jgi:hypothetical protein
MSEASPNAEILRSLGRLVRGLSALFWGLPMALIVCVWTANSEWLTLLRLIPAVTANALLVYGLWQLSGFQTQERVWRTALDRATLLGLVNLGLCPFLYFSSRVPENFFFLAMVIVLGISALMFLGSVNLVLQRLGAMLPDEALRIEIQQFTALNTNLVIATLVIGAACMGLNRMHQGFIGDVLQRLPPIFARFVNLLEHGTFWLPVLFVLLPLAMTMALLWKTKEVILDSVFGVAREV